MTDGYAPVWQPLTESDLDSVVRIASRIHPDLPERAEVFAEKIALFGDGCKKLVLAAMTSGYGISHPWMLQSIPSLDSFLGRLPPRPDCLYIHDVALLPEARGRGAASRYVELMEGVASRSGLRSLALLSVYGSSVLWGRLGFSDGTTPSLQPAMASYGPTAVYMIRATGGQS